MSLLVDGLVNSMQDLRNYENSILEVASSENVDLSGKMALAQDEISIQILHFLLKQETTESTAVPPVLLGQSTRRRLGVSDVTVSPELKRWLALRTLQLAYDDASSNQLNDRYGAKLIRYDALVQAAALSYFETGVGVAIDPVGRAAAPKLELIGGAGKATTFFLRTSWINQAGQEGLASELASFSTKDETQLMATLTVAPINVTGWNAYAGYTPDEPTLQNDAPIPVGTSWTALSELRSGRKPGNGQIADRFIVSNQTLLRG